MDLAKLKEPFPADDIEWRVSRAGEKNGKTWALVLAYVTNRAIQNRLDDVCGPMRWQNEFGTGPDGGVLCGISIQNEIGEWVTKYDGAENTNFEAIKGGLSSAMKRAAVQWGIGRYLYGLSENFVAPSDNGKLRAQYKMRSGEVKYFRYDPPELPAWALPKGENKKPKFATQEQADSLFKLGSDREPPLARKDVIELINDYKQGKKLTYEEANALIEGFDNAVESYIEKLTKE